MVYLAKLLEQQNDPDGWKESAETAITASAHAIGAITDRIIDMKKDIQTVADAIPKLGAEMMMYKPRGVEQHLNIKENYDFLYQRIEALEQKVLELENALQH